MGVLLLGFLHIGGQVGIKYQWQPQGNLYQSIKRAVSPDRENKARTFGHEDPEHDHDQYSNVFLTNKKFART
jgi:hypothetical protein